MKFRHFNIMRLLYCLVLALPFVAILSRVIYVQNNKNAFESYSGNTQLTYYEKVETELPSDLSNGIQQGNYYYASGYCDSTGLSNTYVDLIAESGNFYLSGTYTPNTNIYWGNVNSNIQYWIHIDTQYSNQIEVGIGNISGDNTLIGTYTNISYIEFYGINIYISTFDNANPSFVGMLSETNITQTSYVENTLVQSSLDNVFEYSVNKFIDDNNFGRINLFQWTTNLFFDSNEVNNMYVHFVNWYLNYVLLMSTTYILFLVLMWFVNYSRRLLERGMNYDW